ncbi:MAG TPA: hypothetical protein DCZ91_10340 [Lachnospiraceae bacterium]|nr:hypothetical protein [Lachnospiraceae bacterium]
MRSRKSIFWGMVLLLAAAALLLGRLGYLEGVGFWTILFSACLLSFLVKGIVRLRIGTILFSLAFLVIVNDEWLHLEAITPWPVLGAALLGTVGLKMLFPKLGGYRGSHPVRIGDGSSVIQDYTGDGEYVSYDNVFGEAVKYVSGVIRQVDVDNVFGSVQIYFTEAFLYGGTANVNVDNVFGNVVIYVPRTWNVELNTENVFGFSKQTGKCSIDGENVIHVGGDVIFGNLEVIYV